MHVGQASLVCVPSDPPHTFRCRIAFVPQFLEILQCDWRNFASVLAHATTQAKGMRQLSGTFLVQACVINLFELTFGRSLTQK
mmetsp:Transcript_6802/g.41506  ORF Transcript_6802/g.41506 Transcript_6802/m.41506 type:complete len:83 (-) Transcript_6802:94-342(-)